MVNMGYIANLNLDTYYTVQHGKHGVHCKLQPRYIYFTTVYIVNYFKIVCLSTDYYGMEYLAVTQSLISTCHFQIFSLKEVSYNLLTIQLAW